MIWTLVPIDPGKPNWQASDHGGVVIIHTESDEQARNIATLAFGRAVRSVPGRNTLYPPWRHGRSGDLPRDYRFQISTEGDEEILAHF